MTVLTKMHFERRNEREHTVSHKKFRVAAYGCLFLGPGWQKNSFMAAVRMKREAYFSNIRSVQFANKNHFKVTSLLLQQGNQTNSINDEHRNSFTKILNFNQELEIGTKQ